MSIKNKAHIKHKKLRLSRSTLLLLASFTTILILISTVLTLVLFQINTTNEQINKIVKTNNEKSRLLVEMQKSARERSLSLYQMVNLKDVFERDDTFLEFQRIARKFILARQALYAMPLSEKEKELLDSQGKLSHYAVPLQDKIIELMNEEKFEEAISTLITKSIPAQNAVLNEIEKLINYQTINNEDIVQNLESKLNKNIIIIIITGVTLFILAIGIAILDTRRIVKTEKQLFIEKELAQVTLHSIGDGVITVDKNYIIQTINPVAETLTGTTAEKIIGENILNIYEGRDATQRTEINKSLRNAQASRSLFDFTLTQPDGTSYEVEHTITPIIDQDKNILGAVIILRDVTEMRSMEKRLSYQASHDALTGLINRREFEIRLKQTIRNAQTEQISHSICFLDLDKFKVINDTSGHAAGDEFLKQISSTIQNNLRHTDILARLGGDEFGIILDSCSVSRAKKICTQIIDTIKETRFNWGKNAFETGASIGIVPITERTISASDVMSSVDAACYEAKDKGRNRIQVFEPDDADFVKHRTETSWIQKIKSAIFNNHFELYFQEIIAINPTYPTPRTIEILIRLNDHDKIIVPDSFIPTAERYNMMPLIDEWVISKTFDFLAEYKNKLNQDIRVAINLSGQSLSEDSVLNLITSNLRKNNNLKKECICFEITETAAIANLSRAIEFIASIKQMGCKFSLDDFGSGLSSFSYLKNIPVDNLKIDGVFIRDVVDDPIDRVFVESIHNIGKMMGIKTTAEYVENEEILNCVKAIGIDYAQGYHLARPLPLKTLLASPE